MDSLSEHFFIHNFHQTQSLEHFKKFDPHLKKLASMLIQYQHPLLNQLPQKNQYGVYTLGGGRQIGKTTLLKQWMLKLLEEKISPQHIFFMTGELISDHLKLTEMIKHVIKQDDKAFYLVIDEITYIHEWDKAIKFLADAGMLEQVVLILTGSDLLLIQEARSRFPGRRGKSDVVDFHLYPLNFTEVVDLKLKYEKKGTITEELLLKYFNDYLKHGGFLTAINDYATNQKISRATFRTYSDWILGDMQKRGKQESYLREILKGIIKRYSSSISWNTLSKDLSIDHPSTVADYVHLLARLDVLFIVEALLEDKLVGAPKKGKKIFFQDPFIYHVLNFWLEQDGVDLERSILDSLDNSEIVGTLVEGVVAAHFNRIKTCYYLKNEGEVDIAFIKNKKIFPIEVAWKNQINHKDLKQLKKYKNGRIWGKKFLATGDIPQEFLPLALYDLVD
jgi:predicted AAA+ superfamily ATPase